MTVLIPNRAWETSVTTGAGAITLAGVYANRYQTFNDEIGIGPSFTYWIDNLAGQWETGIGHLSDALTLVRDTISDNSDGNTSAIVFTGTLHVYGNANKAAWDGKAEAVHAHAEGDITGLTARLDEIEALALAGL